MRCNRSGSRTRGRTRPSSCNRRRWPRSPLPVPPTGPTGKSASPTISSAVSLRSRPRDRVARMERGKVVSPPRSEFIRSGHSSGVRVQASGSRQQQRWRLPWPRSDQYAIAGHRRSRVCIDRLLPRPWPEDCSHSTFASPSDRARRSPGCVGPAVSEQSWRTDPEPRLLAAAR